MALGLTFPRQLKHVSTGRVVTAQSAKDYHNLRGAGYADLAAAAAKPAADPKPAAADAKPAK